MNAPTFTVPWDGLPLPVWITRAASMRTRRVLFLAPGAGTSAAHPWLTEQAEALGARGITVVRFDFPYRARGRKAPDRLPALVSAYATVVAHARTELRARPGSCILGGKSMGGRVASHVAAGGCAGRGLVFYGYPLAPQGTLRPERVAHWPEISLPALFLTGTRDRLCPLPALTSARRRWGGPTSDWRLPEGDHGFAVPKRTGLTPEDVHRQLADVVAGWVQALP